jgi:hypothetical protein
VIEESKVASNERLQTYDRGCAFRTRGLLLLLDVYRYEAEGARFATEVVQLTKEEWEDVLRITLVVSEKYFGVPTPIS